MTNFALIEAALDRQSAAITRMVQRQPHVQYNHAALWEQVDEAKKELRAARQPAGPETVSNGSTITVEIPALEFQVGHYHEFPKTVLEKLRKAGIPVTGDWMLRGVEYGCLTITYGQPDSDPHNPIERNQSADVVFYWDSLGNEPEVDPVDELI